MSIDENGTEAAAASVVQMEFTRSGRFEGPPEKELIVDRSFIAMILMEQSNQPQSFVPLFTAVVNKL